MAFTEIKATSLMIDTLQVDGEIRVRWMIPERKFCWFVDGAKNESGWDQIICIISLVPQDENVREFHMLITEVSSDGRYADRLLEFMFHPTQGTIFEKQLTEIPTLIQSLDMADDVVCPHFRFLPLEADSSELIEGELLLVSVHDEEHPPVFPQSDLPPTQDIDGLSEDIDYSSYLHILFCESTCDTEGLPPIPQHFTDDDLEDISW